MRRDLAHHYGVFIHHIFSFLFHTNASSHPPIQTSIKYRAHKVWKKTQGMRRDLGHKGCGWVTIPALRKILTSVSVKGDNSFDENNIS